MQKTRNKLDLPLKKSRNLLEFLEEYSPLKPIENRLITFGVMVVFMPVDLKNSLYNDIIKLEVIAKFSL